MAQREGSVYFWMFFGTFIVLIVAVVFYFVERADNDATKAALAKQKAETKTAQDLTKAESKKLYDLRFLVGGAEDANRWPEDDTYKKQLEDLQQFLNDRFKKHDNSAPKSYTTLVSPYADLKQLIDKKDEVALKSKESQARAVESEKASDLANKEDVKKIEEVVAGLKTQITEAETKYEARISEQSKEGERLQKEAATLKDQLATAEITRAREKVFLENTIASLKTRIDQLEEERRKTRTIEDVEPDGQIIQVASASQIGWVDIGRKQFLRPRMEFRVFQNIKGGKRQYKGRIEIRRVDEKISEFRILETFDELNPIVQGDQVTSPFFDPKAIPVFAMAGSGLDSKEITEEVLVAKIKGYGAEIRDKVDLKTNFLIALKDYEKSDLYKEARAHAVPILTEKDILEYLGL